MLERTASSCLHSSLRYTARSSAHSICSHRQLHSSFWHHGAGDLDLPSWWTIIEPIASSIVRSGDHGSSREHSHQRDIGMLDFLYPPKTLALMNRISEYGFGYLGTNRARQVALARARRFSSRSLRVDGRATHSTDYIVGQGESSKLASRWKDSIATAEFSGVDGALPKISHASIKAASLPAHLLSSLKDEQPQPQYRVDQPLERLHEVLGGTLPAHGESEEFEVVWQLYLQLDSEQREQRVLVSLLNYLSFSTRQVDAVRESFLLASSPALQAPAQMSDKNIGFWSALLTQLRVGDAERAVFVHENATQANSKGYLGTNLLLAHLLRGHCWDLALQVYATKMKTVLDADKEWLSDDRTNVWNLVEGVPNLVHIASKFLEHVERKLDPTYANVRNFVVQLVVKASLQSIHTSSSAHHKILSLLQTLKLLRLDSAETYELIMRDIVSLLQKKYRHDTDYPEHSKLLAQLYVMYREVQGVHPHLELMNGVAKIMAEVGSVATDGKFFSKALQQIVSDYTTLLRLERMPSSISESMMRMHARKGEASRVLELFNDLSRNGAPIESLAFPLINVFASRAETAEAVHQFKRLESEFNWKPTTPCWNVLLRAFARADDLEQCLKYFKDMQKSGTNLDGYSFLPILQLYSRRGDSAKIVELLELAQSSNIPISTKMFFYLVFAHIQNSNMSAAEEAAEALTQAQEQSKVGGEGSLLLVWNHVLEGHAKQRNWEGVMRAYNYMQSNNIKPDTKTYSALIKGLCTTNQTDTAWKMLNNLSINGFQVLPVHYRQVIMGYTKQRQPVKAIMAYNQMIKAGIEPDGSTKVAYLRAKSLREAHDVDPSPAAAEAVEAKFRRTLEELGVSKQDAKKSAKDVRTGNNTTLDAAKETLIMNYGSAGLYDVASRWSDIPIKNHKTAINFGDLPSMKILHALMVVHLHAGRHDEVENCWKGYLQQAKTFARIAPSEQSHEEPADENQPISGEHMEPNSPLVLESLTNSRPSPLARSRRHILSSPMALYIKSLAAQDKRVVIENTINSVIGNGWTLDNIVWNIYIRALVAHSPSIRLVEDSVPSNGNAPIEARISQTKSNEFNNSPFPFTSAKAGTTSPPQTQDAAPSDLASQHDNLEQETIGPSMGQDINSEPQEYSSMPLPSQILTAFCLTEEKLMPNFPGWVKTARPLNASQRRAKYAGGLDWMRTDRLGRLWRGLLVPQFQTLLELRDCLGRLEKAEVIEQDKALEEQRQPEKTWSWEQGREITVEEDPQLTRIREQQELARQAIEDSIIETGNIPPDEELEGMELRASVLLEAIRRHAPRTVDAVASIPEIEVPIGFGEVDERKGGNLLQRVGWRKNSKGPKREAKGWRAVER